MLIKSIARRCLPGWVLDTRRRLQNLHLMETNLFFPAPEAIKHVFIRKAQQVLQYSTFVETGTYRGDTTARAAGWFRRVHTIEVEPELARQARIRFADTPNVEVHEGDSAVVLPRLLETVTESAVFWLDGHYSGGPTGRGELETPIMAELEAIRAHPVRPHAIFIDDARVFGVDPAYPTLEELFVLLRGIDPTFRIGVLADLVWASPVELLRFEWQTTETGEVVLPATPA